MCKKLLLLFCLVSCLSQLYATPSFHIDWTKVDDNLNLLEWNLNTAETTIKSLQMDLEEQQKFSANQQLQYKTLEDKYQKSEKATKLWKGISIVAISSTITLGAIVVWQQKLQ